MAVSSDHLQKDTEFAPSLAEPDPYTMGVSSQRYPSRSGLSCCTSGLIREYPVTDAAEEAKVTETTAIQVYQ